MEKPVIVWIQRIDGVYPPEWDMRDYEGRYYHVQDRFEHLTVVNEEGIFFSQVINSELDGTMMEETLEDQQMIDILINSDKFSIEIDPIC